MEKAFFYDLKKRIGFSLLWIGIIVFFIFFSYLWFFKPIVTCLIAVITAVALWEFYHLTKIKQPLFLPVLMAFGVMEIISFALAAFSNVFYLAPVFILFVFLFILFIHNFSTIQGSISRISTSLFGFVYVTIPMGMVLSILYLPHQDGRLWVFYLILVTKISDIAAYFGGRLYGSNKLAIKVSPKKTWEGAVTGFIFAVVASVIFVYCTKACNGLFSLDVLGALVLGSLLGSIGQIGDLCESLLKRDAKIKDSNNILGFGGILDMLDSLLFNIPIIFFFVMS